MLYERRYQVAKKATAAAKKKRTVAAKPKSNVVMLDRQLTLDERIERGWVRLMDHFEQMNDLTIREEIAILLAFERMQYRRVKKGPANVGATVKKYEHEFAARNAPDAATRYGSEPEPAVRSWADELTNELLDALESDAESESEPDPDPAA